MDPQTTLPPPLYANFYAPSNVVSILLLQPHWRVKVNCDCDGDINNNIK